MFSTIFDHGFKDIADFFLAKTPLLYANVLQKRAIKNTEKILFLKLIQERETVLDIGANRGYYTLLFSNLVGEKGEVHGFEPVPSTFNLLAETIAKKQFFKNIYLNNVALSDENTTLTIYVPDDDDGQASLQIHNSGSWQDYQKLHSYKCRSMLLDDYSLKHLNKGLDFIKCDIEGAELLCLQGSRKTLEQYHPLIYLEVCPEWTKNFGYSPPDIVDFLLPLGYSQFYLSEPNLHLLKEPRRELSEQNLSQSANLLCAIPEFHQAKLARLRAS